MTNYPKHSICDNVISTPEELLDWWSEMADSCDESAENYNDYASESGLYEGLDCIKEYDPIREAVNDIS